MQTRNNNSLWVAKNKLRSKNLFKICRIVNIKEKFSATCSSSNQDLIDLNIGIRIKIKKKVNDKKANHQIFKRVNPSFIRNLKKASSA